MITSIISGSGSYIPENVVQNSNFIQSSFYGENGIKLSSNNEDIIEKFYQITGIKERRYAVETMLNSDMATIAAQRAINEAKIDKEEIDQIIVAHNFGDVPFDKPVPDMLPSIASKVKHQLKIKNPSCVAFDVVFGCPGWVQAMIQADVFIKSGYAKKCLVIGSETLSRMADPFDRDSMIYADGAGAVMLEASESKNQVGIINHAALSHTTEEVHFLMMGEGFFEETKDANYMKMNGRKIYNYALTNVPKAIKLCIDKSGFSIEEVSKILIHQANEKMDLAIADRLYQLYGIEKAPVECIPMNIQKIGNNSVATVPVLYDMISKNNLPNYSFKSGELIVMASVGAGMNINALTYKIP
jgi:3-oxoacyl-[acyl-carrier-protein] synthase III